MSNPARADIDRQRILDGHWEGNQGALLARMRAVVKAQHRMTLRDPDAPCANR